MKTRKELKMQAKEAMRSQRTTAVLLILVMALKMLALGVFNDIAIGRLNWFLLFAINLLVVLALIALMVNVMREYLKIYRSEHTHVMALYPDFMTHLGHNMGGMMWMALWGFIWSLISVPVILLAVYLMRTTGRGMRLLAIVLVGPVHLIALIPAIVKGISYGMTPFILTDQPDIPAREALKLSMRMMAGHKKELFKLALSFLGWYVLAVLTFGILYITYVGPYYYTTLAGFYEEVRTKEPPGTADEAETVPDTVSEEEAAAIKEQAEIDALNAIDGGDVEVVEKVEMEENE
jgi:uncharacterized membrane protein